MSDPTWRSTTRNDGKRDLSPGQDHNKRPWCCPQPTCTPVLNVRDGDYRDITVYEPGQTWFCWGEMEQPLTFTYDGVEHTNDLNACSYTALKGVIRYQENLTDWSVMALYYKAAGEIVRERRAVSSLSKETEK